MSRQVERVEYGKSFGDYALRSSFATIKRSVISCDPIINSIYFTIFLEKTE